MWYSFRPYVRVARRRAQAAREVEKRHKKGQNISPVVIEGRNIANTFWGKAWCENLESYSDYENRLPRGRTYVRNGSVVDLQIHPGKITALVSGSEPLHSRHHHRAAAGRPVAAHQAPLRRPDRLAGGIAAGPAVEERDGHRHGPRRRPVPQAAARSRCRVPARIGPACASTSPPSCTASERGSITSPSCSSACARSIIWN